MSSDINDKTGVSSTHPRYDAFSSRWGLVINVVDSDVSGFLHKVPDVPAGRARKYADDAILTNFTSRTKHGLVGVVFRNSPQIEVPNELEYLLVDATGNNLPLNQLAQAVVGDVLETGHEGLLVDFSSMKGEAFTKEDVKLLNGQARILKYEATSIINWQSSRVGSKTVLTLVVLTETVSKLADDGFTWISETQFRVLRLTDNVYTQQMYGEDEQPISEEVTPVKADGSTWDEIPFQFIGSENNDAQVDNSPMYDLALINIGHYKNSADYEESVHVQGQGTAFVSSSLSSDQWATANPNGMSWGSRAVHFIGQGGSATLLQAPPNHLADEAMKRKEEQAVMIGAKLITPSSGVETAEAARMRHGSEVSILNTIVHNVSTGIHKTLQWAGMFQGTEDEMIFELNNQFFDDNIDPQTLMASIQLMNMEVIDKKDVRLLAKKAGVLDNERTDEEIDRDLMESAATRTPAPIQDREQGKEDQQDEQE